MATVMTSHRHDAPPPLPSRNSTTGRQIHRSQSSVESSQNATKHSMGRKSSLDQTPPSVPPINYTRPPMDTPTGGAGRLRRGVSNENNPPPLPNRNGNSDKSQLISRKSFETKSFINRHTARAYSNPDDPTIMSDEDPPPPPPPSLKTIPKRNSVVNEQKKLRDVYDAEDPFAQRQNSYTASKNKSPVLPPGRPPKTSVVNSPVNDLERRFTFHDVKDFPSPEPMEFTNKNYPSLNQSVRVKKYSNASSPRDHLGPL